MQARSVMAIVILTASTLVFGQAKKENVYNYTVDLTRVVNDRIYVELSPPSISTSEATFYFPKVVPGTYAIADYGRFVNDLTVSDKKGNKLPVERVDENTWKIKNATKASKISYWVDDTFDTPVSGPEIFWPAGTNIEENKNYIINTSGFFGYFDGLKEVPYQFNVVRAKEWYGSTGLIPTKSGVPSSALKLEKTTTDKNKLVDVYKTVDYDQLIDSPLMYSKPDTAMIRVANAEVLIGSYSPNNKVTAKEIAASIHEVLMAQKEYLGGKLPVDKYAFIFYFTDQPIESYGALEHSYSSFYYMPEMTIEQMNQQLRDFAAHEFFHIVTPLTVHSEEIEFFDYNHPKMSQHLWMYEGVTEYFAGNVQVKYQLISPEQYLQVLREKMYTSDQFKNDVPFTDISQYTLDKYHDQYYNVYQKGALIGLCLDLKLRQLSKGKYGLRNLLLDLSKKFGKNKAFKDDELFDIITKMTYPEIGDFFSRYVKGTEKLPLQEVFNTVGIIYKEEDKIQDYSLGIGQQNIGVAMVNNQLMLEISSISDLNAMGKALGFEEGDALVKINGEPIPAIAAPGDSIPTIGPEFGAFIQKQVMSLPTSKTLSYTIMRKDANGDYKEKELSTPVTQIEIVRRHVLLFDPAAAGEQLTLRDSWLKP